MYKKILIIGLIVGTALGLLYYANIKIIKNENKKFQEELQTKINNLQNELQAKNEEFQKNKEPDKDNNINTNIGSTHNLIISDVKIQTNEAYNEGLVKGAIYGAFNVAAKVKNTGTSDVLNTKVVSMLVKSNSRYAKDIGVDAKSQGIDKLAPGEEKELTFLGYHVVHPETYQEIMINILEPGINGIVDSNIKRIRIKVAFPPGSND